MTKVNRREAILFLLGGAGVLSGCTYLGTKQPVLPKDCVWLHLPYTFACLDLQGIYDESGMQVGESYRIDKRDLPAGWTVAPLSYGSETQ
jgi:hypothetical protein